MEEEMSIEPDAQNVPTVAWEYWGIVSFSIENPGLYGMDEKRTNCHERLCQYYKIAMRDSRKITDHLDKYKNAVQMHDALKLLSKETP
jgi:hypothetical protein